MCVKGRYGFDYISSSERLTKPLIRLENSVKRKNDKFNTDYILSNFREASWDEALDRNLVTQQDYDDGLETAAEYFSN